MAAGSVIKRSFGDQTRTSGDGARQRSFQRVVPLPVRVRPDAATARYRDGVLRVELTKLEPGKPKRVSVEVV